MSGFGPSQDQFVQQYKGDTSKALLARRTQMASSDLDGGLSKFSFLDKTGPDSLAEQLDNSSEAAGAMIFIKTLSGGSITAITNNFYLVSLSFSYKERVQLMENFNSANVAFFGETAKVYQLQGVALDYASTDENDPGKYFHQSGLIDMYNSVLRGSKLVEKDSVAVLKVLNHTIEGYPLNLQVAYSSQSDKMAQFSMSWVVTRHDMVMERYLTKTRLEAFYGVTPKSDTTLKNVDVLISLIDEFLNIKNRKNFPDKFLNEDLFFDMYSTGETEYIINNIKASSDPTNPGIPVDTFNAYLNILKQELILINAQKTIVAKETNLVFDPDDTEENFVRFTPDEQEALVDFTQNVISHISKLRMSLVLYKLNRLYFGPATKAVTGTTGESSALTATAATPDSIQTVKYPPNYVSPSSAPSQNYASNPNQTGVPGSRQPWESNNNTWPL